MIHTKFSENRPAGSGEDFLVFSTIYGHGGHLGHVTRISFPLPMDTPHKISLSEIFEKCVWMTDRPRSREDLDLK